MRASVFDEPGRENIKVMNNVEKPKLAILTRRPY
jgi:hypothetical protein